jgi:hypothetical protein
MPKAPPATTIDMRQIAELLDRLEQRAIASDSTPSLKRDCALVVRVVQALLHRATINKWPIDISNEGLCRGGER